MRKIKFRAWDKNAEMLIEWEDLKDNQTPSYLFDKYSRFDVMQFTGLKDKNGKEIYEGDVVWRDLNRFPYVVEWNSGNERDGRAKRHGFWPMCQDITDHTYEIIGNIYENPELKKI